MISLNGARKYIVDIVGDLPVILMELNNNGTIMKTYIYANGQIIAQHTAGEPAQNNQYFFLHDRLGSVDKKTGGKKKDQIKNRWLSLIN